MENRHRLCAFIWDYDGTLVDTQHKNLNVTRKIVESFPGLTADDYTALQSIEKYGLANNKWLNWREFYEYEMHFSENQIDAAGRLWTAYQLMDQTPVPFYPGIEKVIRRLKKFPQGIVSQNSRGSIIRQLEQSELLPFFKYIVGYEEVDFRKQKPNPEGLMKCINKLSLPESGCIFYIGDHITDVQCADRANRILEDSRPGIQIISIGAYYHSENNRSTWPIHPDFEIYRVEDIIDIVKNYV